MAPSARRPRSPRQKPGRPAVRKRPAPTVVRRSSATARLAPAKPRRAPRCPAGLRTPNRRMPRSFLRNSEEVAVLASNHPAAQGFLDCHLIDLAIARREVAVHKLREPDRAFHVVKEVGLDNAAFHEDNVGDHLLEMVDMHRRRVLAVPAEPPEQSVDGGLRVPDNGPMARENRFDVQAVDALQGLDRTRQGVLSLDNRVDDAHVALPYCVRAEERLRLLRIEHHETARVAGGIEDFQGQRPKADLVTLPEAAVDGEELGPGIVKAPPCADVVTAVDAVLLVRMHPYFATRFFAEEPVAARVITMTMGIDNELYILGLQSKGAQRRDRVGQVVLEAGIDQYRSRRFCDEVIAAQPIALDEPCFGRGFDGGPHGFG